MRLSFLVPSGMYWQRQSHLKANGKGKDYQFSDTTEVAANMDIETGEDKLSAAHKSGIEVLLHVSNMAVPGALEEIADPGRASPSTREAIVDMLTMSRGFNSPTSEHNGSLSASSLDKSNAPPVPAVFQRQRKGRRRLNSSLTDDYGDVVSKVHQDDEYRKHLIQQEPLKRQGTNKTMKDIHGPRVI